MHSMITMHCRAGALPGQAHCQAQGKNFAYVAVGHRLLLINIVASSFFCTLILALALAAVKLHCWLLLYDADSFPAALECFICMCPLDDRELVQAIFLFLQH